ncbi:MULTISPECIES: reverse transcriptase N-terminal domain-containing protein [unclassified Streptomyces]|uniref:reverse transcriptase N-terminal domain-containing protein n=1 Tax=unclassified Streptomyces TaxID=2593676 RepID=UPI003817FA03
MSATATVTDTGVPSAVNGRSGGLDARAWSDIDWTKANENVRRLRQRIYRAAEEGNWRQGVNNLSKLMLRAHSNTLTSVRRVTQLSTGLRRPESTERPHSLPRRGRPWRTASTRRPSSGESGPSSACTSRKAMDAVAPWESRRSTTGPCRPG